MIEKQEIERYCPEMRKKIKLNTTNFYKDVREGKNGFSIISKKGIIQRLIKSSNLDITFEENCRTLDRPFLLDLYNYVFDKEEDKCKAWHLYYKICLQQYKELTFEYSVKEIINSSGIPKLNQIIEYYENKISNNLLNNIIDINLDIKRKKIDIEEEKKQDNKTNNINTNEVEIQLGKNELNNNKVTFTDEDSQIKNDVIRLIGYDPFDGYDIFDQKFLYNELLTYLDESTLDDSFKLSQIIQLVNNNNQIRKIDLNIATISKDAKALLANQADIKSLTAIKNQIVQSTDKIAKENAISVKNRGEINAGKSTLTYLMRNYRESGFEAAEEDYFDQKKAKGIRLVADISNQSILDQLQLDENDVNDMFFNQRKLIQELEMKVTDLEEENRQLYVQITELKAKQKLKGQ